MASLGQTSNYHEGVHLVIYVERNIRIHVRVPIFKLVHITLYSTSKYARARTSQQLHIIFNKYL
jgi:hypothetical protein